MMNSIFHNGLIRQTIAGNSVDKLLAIGGPSEVLAPLALSLFNWGATDSPNGIEMGPKFFYIYVCENAFVRARANAFETAFELGAIGAKARAKRELLSIKRETFLR